MQGAEWTRLREGSGVHWGEGLIYVAYENSPPPSDLIVELIGWLSNSSTQWSVRRIALPEDANYSVERWLAALGHPIAPRSWSTRLISLPRAFSIQNEPVFWVGDCVIFQLEGPTAHATSMVTLDLNTNSFTESITTGSNRESYVAVSSLTPGLATLAVAQNRKAAINLRFELRPDINSISKLLGRSPRLRLWLDDICLESWRRKRNSVPASARRADDIHLDVGVEGAHVSVVITTTGKRRVYRSLALSDAESVIRDSLPVATTIEIDADNLGRLAFAFQRSTQSEPHSSIRRLGWWRHIRSSQLTHDDLSHTVFNDPPKKSLKLIPRRVGAIGLIHSRLALKQRHKQEKAPL